MTKSKFQNLNESLKSKYFNDLLLKDSFVIGILTFVILAFSVAGCRPTYTNDNIEQSIVKICKDEYKLDVTTKRIGRTLGVYVPISGLFESTVKKQGRNTTLEDVLSGIRFSKAATEKIGDVSMALSRAAISTDAPIDFYVLVASDTKASGLEIIITRYALDMKRFMLGDVSMGDYHQRLLMDMDFGPVTAAEETAREFFNDLERVSSQAVITRYFSKISNIRIESPDFFLYISELNYKDNRKFYIAKLKGAQIEKNKVLVRCKVKETYTPSQLHEGYRFLYPSGFTNEYLILLDTSYIPYLIERVLLLNAADEEGNIRKLPFPAKYKEYENFNALEKNGFFLEEITFPDFLARQLSGRIRELYQAQAGVKNKFVMNLIKGEYQPAAKKFKIVFDIESKGVKREEVDFNPMWKIISDVMRQYDFKDYGSVELFNIADSKKEVMNRQELLDKFWPKWLLRK